MKKIMIPFITAAALMSAGLSFADNAAVNKTANTANTQPAQSSLNLYANPSTSANVVTTVSINQRLVPIFQKDGWIKVGDPANGNVGWINKDQYQKAMDTAIHQSVQTIYVEQTDQKGKAPQITVYQNGKKLTGAEAQKVYANLQQQQKQIQKNIGAFQHSMDHWFNQQMQVMNSPMMSVPMMPMLQPVIIVENATTPQPAQPAKLEQVKPETK